VEHWQALREIGPSKDPALCAIFRRTAPRRRPEERDALGEVAVRKYVGACAHFEEEVAERIDSLVATATPVILWGVGTHALHLMESTSLYKANIVALVDANPRLHGMRVGGRLVAGPESVAGRPEALLICSPLRQDEIIKMARERYAMSNSIMTLY
jgi:FlaA1/EpsC-like NDP-sugar epimerase